MGNANKSMVAAGEIFDLVDTDKSGDLNMEELKQLVAVAHLRTLGIKRRAGVNLTRTPPKKLDKRTARAPGNC